MVEQEPENTDAGPSGADQFRDGVKQMATGAGQIYGDHIAPNLSGGLENLLEQTSTIRASRQWQAWMPLVVPGAALLGLFGLVLPIMRMSMFGDVEHMFLFGQDVEQSGAFVLVLYLIVLVAGIIGLAIPTKWAHTTSALVSMIIGLYIAWTGLILFIAGVSMNYGFGELASIAPHLGTYVMILVGAAMILAGIVWTIRIYSAPKTPAPAGVRRHPPSQKHSLAQWRTSPSS